MKKTILIGATLANLFYLFGCAHPESTTTTTTEETTVQRPVQQTTTTTEAVPAQ